MHTRRYDIGQRMFTDLCYEGKLDAAILSMLNTLEILNLLSWRSVVPQQITDTFRCVHKEKHSSNPEQPQNLSQAKQLKYGSLWNLSRQYLEKFQDIFTDGSISLISRHATY
jgi:hypothetical protein